MCGGKVNQFTKCGYGIVAAAAVSVIHLTGPMDSNAEVPVPSSAAVASGGVSLRIVGATSPGAVAIVPGLTSPSTRTTPNLSPASGPGNTLPHGAIRQDITDDENNVILESGISIEHYQ